jgi:hypothetical protein
MIAPLVDYIRASWCRGNGVLFEYVMNWFAAIIQQPMNPEKTALLIRGTHASNAIDIIDFIGRAIIGRRHYLNRTDDRATSGYDDDPRERLLVLVSEEKREKMQECAAAAPSPSVDIAQKKPSVKLADLVTQRPQDVAHFIFVSTNKRGKRVGLNERNCCTLNCADTPEYETRESVRAVVRTLERCDAARHIFTYFARRELTKFDIRAIPAAVVDVGDRIDSLAPVERFVYEIGMGHIAEFSDEDENYAICPRDFFASFDRWCVRAGISSVITEYSFDIEVARIIGSARQERIKTIRRRVRRFTLAFIRRKIAELYRITF